MTARFGQDKWVMSLLPKPGFFVDVGCGNGLVTSNTLNLENAGWKGILIDGNKKSCRRARKCRTSPVYWTCISDRHRRVSFIQRGVRSALVEFSRPIIVETRIIRRRYAVTLQFLLDMLGIEAIDYLSMDIEGAELQALSRLRIRPKVITVEKNKSSTEVHKLLEARGYRLAKDFRDDEGWIHVESFK